jgi:hypothetical protein
MVEEGSWEGLDLLEGTPVNLAEDNPTNDQDHPAPAA